MAGMAAGRFELKDFLQGLAEKLVQVEIQNTKIIKYALDKAVQNLPESHHSEVIENRDLYEDLLRGYIEELSSQKYQFDLPYNLYLSNDHRKIDRMVNSGFWEQKDVLIRNLLGKKFSSFSNTDILKIMNVARNQLSQGRTTLLLEDLQTLKTISGRLTDCSSLFKLMSVTCRIFLSSAKKSTDKSIRKQISTELKTLLITCKTRFTLLENVSPEETSDFYDYLAGLSCLYAESVAMVESKPIAGDNLCTFVTYLLGNSLQHQLDLLLQIDQNLKNENVLMPLISKTLEFERKNLSCEMYLRYVLATRHVCIPQQFNQAKSRIRQLKKDCLNLQMPSTFYEWLTAHLPILREHLDPNDDIPKYLMSCPEYILESLILLLSRKPCQGADGENLSQDDISNGETLNTKSDSPQRKRKSSTISEDEEVVPQKQFKCILGK